MKKFRERVNYIMYMGVFGFILAMLYISILGVRSAIWVGSLPFALARGKLPKWSEKSFHPETPLVDTPS